MSIWLAMRDAIALVTPYEDLIMDGVPAPVSAFSKVAVSAVVSAMVSGGSDGTMLMASSTIPTGVDTAFTVTTTSADTAGWLLCNLSTLKSVATTAGGGATWSSSAEQGSMLVFGSKTPCHADSAHA